MSLLLTLVFLQHDKTVQESFNKLEAAIASATSISFDYTEKGSVSVGGSISDSYIIKGTFYLKVGGKVFISEEAQHSIFGTTPPMTRKSSGRIVSDGSTMRVSRAMGRMQSVKTPMKIDVFLRKSLTRFRMQMIPLNLSQATEDSEIFKNAETWYEPLCVLSEKEDAGKRLLECSLTFSYPPVHARVMLWCDPKCTQLIKRTWEIPGSSTVRTVEETFVKFTLNAEVPDEKFKLPDEK